MQFASCLNEGEQRKFLRIALRRAAVYVKIFAKTVIPSLFQYTN